MCRFLGSLRPGRKDFVRHEIGYYLDNEIANKRPWGQRLVELITN